MKIERISLENVSVSPHSGAHVATVLLHSDTASFTMRASAMLASRLTSLTESSIVTRALVQDALRQVRHMPEFRNAPQTVVVADTAWPISAEQA
ncbi:hypothetical protein [Roseovarius confluentis]|jgi:hypothetical protein|uniref:hypothetical protein n=1 Tax=Roseovarius confluentis TaxID=1852027 RepID=UPI0032F13984